jgi:catechol 2,3-dioxygenase
MVTLPLDLDDLLAQAAPEESAAMPEETIVGHVHLKVSDVSRAVAFYREALGFEEQAQLPSAGFLSAGGYHHHVGLNSWQSQGGQPAPDNAPGLRLVEFELSDAEALGALERRFSEGGGGAGEDSKMEGNSSPARETDGQLALRDRDGHALVFRSPTEHS